ncbi:glycoside hydrolase family 32 protein [Aquimarina sp. M1]
MSCKKVERVKNPEPMVKNVMSSNEEQLYRPNFHFTPKANWMNDPNGMFYLNGTYHLFFQYYPNDNVWGPMHWGHAVSEDLVDWEEKEIAIYPDSLGYIFSGSAVVDKKNTSGLGSDSNPPVVAMYTYHDPVGEENKRIDFQTQGIAYSIDQGKNWTKYTNNPVINNPGIRDFRDPKIIWDKEYQQWLMALAADDKVKFYTSQNLIDWSFLSDFGQDIGAHGGVWECPDFFPMKVGTTGEEKWVLLLSINPGAPNGGSGTQYFVGDFDGTVFELDTNFKNQINKNQAVWLDYGRDNYAGVTWSGIPDEDGRKLFIGWMSNWDYGQQVPTSSWRSSMTVPRALTLHKNQETYRLLSYPVAELNKYHTKTAVRVEGLTVKKNKVLFKAEEAELSSADIMLTVEDLTKNKLSFILSNDKQEELRFGFDPDCECYFLDRSKAGKVNFSDKFVNTFSKAPFDNKYLDWKLRVLLDKTSIEIFINQGGVTMTEIFFTEHPFNTLSVKSDSELNIKELSINLLK